MAILSIPITKASVAAKADAPATIAALDVDTARISVEMELLIWQKGLEAILNSRMSAKLVGAVTKKTGKDLLEAQAAAMKIATENLTALYAGETKAKKSKTAKSLDADGQPIPQAVMTEALRQAREVVKNEMRKAKIKISQVKASEITEAARQIIAGDQSYIAKAHEALAAREAIVSTIDISAIVKLDPKKVKAAEDKKAEKATQLSKTQASIPTRRKPASVPAPAMH